jgi:hypothetical protein
VDYALLEALQDQSTLGYTTADQYIYTWRARGMKGDLIKRAQNVLAARAQKSKA